MVHFRGLESILGELSCLGRYLPGAIWRAGRTRALQPLLGTIVLCLLAGCASSPPAPTSPSASPRTLTVSAAADLTAPFTDLGQQFEQKTGTHVTFNFGASGTLAQQIEQGAPVDLFAAANRGFVDDLAKRDLILPDSVQLYARGSLVLWERQDSPLPLNELTDLLQPQVKRVAIANPEHAPYGMAAKEALQRAGVWDAIQPKLVLGENIQQTFQFAATGNVDAALVSLSLAADSNGHWVLVPQELYTPLDQALGIVKGGRDIQDARAFAEYVTGSEGRKVLAHYGFGLPGGPP